MNKQRMLSELRKLQKDLKFNDLQKNYSACEFIASKMQSIMAQLREVRKNND